jgi:hypothetical protein
MRAPYDKIGHNTVFDLPACVNQARAGLEHVDIELKSDQQHCHLKGVPRKGSLLEKLSFSIATEVMSFHDKRGASVGLAGIVWQQ